MLVKPEYLNPGGSVKDRAATAMVLATERDGSLRPDRAVLLRDGRLAGLVTRAELVARAG